MSCPRLDNAMSPDRARTRTARSGDERTNHEASALPHAMLYGKGTTLSQPLVQALKINNFISSWKLQVSRLPTIISITER